MAETLKLPIVDLSSSDAISTAKSIRQACIECGFFYLVNHGVEEELLLRVFDESRKFFSLSLEEKMKLAAKHHRGYTPMYAENLDYSSSARGDSKESFYIGPLEAGRSNLNRWPSEDILPSWRLTMESYHKKLLLEAKGDYICLDNVVDNLYKVPSLSKDRKYRQTQVAGSRSVGKKLISLIAQALDLDADFFEKVGALDDPMPFLRLLHYPGELEFCDGETYGASAHSDYGMVTLLATNGVPGLQVCREKFKQPRIWEDVPHMDGAFIVNIGDMMERWTNCLFRSTMHRVMPEGQERYSLAFFLDPNENCLVECLKSCCSDSSPPRFPPIRSGAYLENRLSLTFSSEVTLKPEC